MVIDRATRLVYANPAAEALLGVTSSVGESMLESVHRDDRPGVQARLAAVAAGRVPDGFALRARFRDVSGQWRLLELYGANRLDDPVVNGILLSARDVTELDGIQERRGRGIERALETVTGISERRGRCSVGHQARVAALARAIARKLDLNSDTVQGIGVAAAIHDVGEIAVPARILAKPAVLTGAELARVRVHPRAGHDLMKDVEFPWPVAQMILEHHERWDGSGYPQHLVGRQTLLGSRIIMVADVVEAMSAKRPYRAGEGLVHALVEIGTGSGRQYDPVVAQACLELFESGAFAFDTSAAGDPSAE